MGLAEFKRRYPVAPAKSSLSYQPRKARHLRKILNHHSMTPAERRVFRAQGFVVLDEAQAYGELYDAAFHEHLPIVVTADSVLYAFHRSYDAVLIELEHEVAIPELDGLLRELHEQLAARSTPDGLADAARDLDTFFTVGRRLLADEDTTKVEAVFTDTNARAEALVASIDAESPGSARVFGDAVAFDYSMLKPRGHYTLTPELYRYFRAMSWIQRVPFRVLRPAGGGGPALLDRRAADALVVLVSLLDDDAIARWSRVDEILMRMVGEQDNAELPEVRDAVAEWARDLPAYASVPDAPVADLMGRTIAGKETLSSALVHGGDQAPAARPSNFYLMGQRFVLDGSVFSRVVYDRLTDGEGVPITRMEPSVMDVQFALGSNAAGALLEPDLEGFRYQGTLHELRASFDAMPEDAWDVSIYGSWLGAIRSLNFNEEPELLPEPLRTRAWQHKVLNTQLASWAELRRDNILYAKQTFTAVPLCEFPDAYVEPYPQFFRAMARLHETGGKLVAVAPPDNRKKMAAFFARGAEISRRLASIADDELHHRKRSPKDKLFLQRMIDSTWSSGGCGGGSVLREWDGWYTELFWNSRDAFEFESAVAYVHTTATDASGNTIGHVLHAGTTMPRTMILTIPDQSGKPCAFVGAVSQFRTTTTRDFKRLDDGAWNAEVPSIEPEPWQRDFMPSRRSR